ncbi:unnamed protein product [Discula destructiva]
MAILKGDVDTVAFFVSLGANISDHHQWTLYQAYLEGFDMIKTLLVSPSITSSIYQPSDGGDSIHHFVFRTPSARFRNSMDLVKDEMRDYVAEQVKEQVEEQVSSVEEDIVKTVLDTIEMP